MGVDEAVVQKSIVGEDVALGVEYAKVGAVGLGFACAVCRCMIEAAHVTSLNARRGVKRIAMRVIGCARVPSPLSMDVPSPLSVGVPSLLSRVISAAFECWTGML